MVSFSLFVVSMVFCSVSLQPVASNSGGVQGDQMTHRHRFVLTCYETIVYDYDVYSYFDDDARDVYVPRFVVVLILFLLYFFLTVLFES